MIHCRLLDEIEPRREKERNDGRGDERLISSVKKQNIITHQSLNFQPRCQHKVKWFKVIPWWYKLFYWKYVTLRKSAHVSRGLYENHLQEDLVSQPFKFSRPVSTSFSWKCERYKASILFVNFWKIKIIASFSLVGSKHEYLLNKTWT